MEKFVLELMQRQKEARELGEIVGFNEKSSRFGLMLTEQEAQALMECRNESLLKYKRVEFGKGILEKLMFVFCDSQYLIRDHYLEALEKLQDIFYLFKNETQDRMTDDEILHFMREQFDGVCAGDIQYLESTCLERLSRAVRQGFRGYEQQDGRGIYEEVDEEERWDPELYYQVLKELTWD